MQHFTIDTNPTADEIASRVEMMASLAPSGNDDHVRAVALGIIDALLEADFIDPIERIRSARGVLAASVVLFDRQS